MDNYGVRVLDLSKVVYKDDSWILTNRAAQVFYAEPIISSNEKKSTNKPKHVVFLGKQQAIGVSKSLRGGVNRRNLKFINLNTH